MSAGKKGKLSQLPVLFPVAAFVIGFIGWAHRYGWDFASHTPQIVIHSVTIFIPSVSNLLDGNWLTQTAAMMGTLSTMFGALYFWISSTGRTIDNLWTNVARRAHTIIIGDTDFAQSLQTALSAKGTFVIRVVPVPLEPGANRTVTSRVLPIGYHIPAIAKGTGLSRCAHIVIDLGSDVETLALAKSLIAKLDEGGGSRCRSVALRLADSVYGAHFIDQITAARTINGRGGDIAHLTIFDENSVAAQFLCARAMPYLRAAKRGQSRVHALIIGFSDAGEKLMDQVFLTCSAKGLDAPRVTVVDKDADNRRLEFNARRPDVADSLGVEFVSLNVETDPLAGALAGTAAQRLQAIEAECPFTVVFLAQASDVSHIRSGFLLLAHQKRNRLTLAPIFTVTDSDTVASAQFFAENPPAFEAGEGACCLSLPDDTYNMVAHGNPDVREIARIWHEAYRKANASQSADIAWEKLPESLRQANKRAAAHLPAMLWSMGLDDGQGGPPGPARSKRIDELTDLLEHNPGSSEIDDLARLEHERWMIERKLDGWRHGKVRNNDRKFHPLLIDWAALKAIPGEIDKDIARLRDILTIARG